MRISLFAYILWGTWVQRVADANQGKWATTGVQTYQAQFILLVVEIAKL